MLSGSTIKATIGKIRLIPNISNIEIKNMHKGNPNKINFYSNKIMNH